MDHIEPTPESRFIDDARIKKVRSAIRTADIDGLLGITPSNSYYLSGAYFGFYQRPVCGLITEHMSGIVCSNIREETVRRTSWCDRGILYNDVEAPFDVLIDLIGAADIDTLGVDMYDTKWGWISKLERKTDVTLVDRTDLFTQLRSQKTEWEIDKIRRTGDLADAGMEAFVDEAETGMAEIELVQTMEKAYFDEYLDNHSGFDLGNAIDGSQYSFTNVLTGDNAFSAGKLATSRTIADGECVMSIAIPALQGYHCENERALIIGEPSDAVVSAMETHVDLRREIIEYLGPDKTAAEVDEFAYDRFKSHGIELKHRTGHGLGIAFHEAPGLNRSKSIELKPGMVVTVEPGVYMPNERAVIRHSDSIVITETGAERLTNTDDGVLIK